MHTPQQAVLINLASDLLRTELAAAIYLPLADGKVLYMGSVADIAGMLPDQGAAVRGEAVAEDCGACHGSGWVVRDPDIGTDQECFSCGGSGKSDEEPEESHPAWARTILYTDTIGGKQTCRDDLWAITGDELRLFQAAQKSMGAHHDLLQVVAKAAGFTESGCLRDLPEFIAAKVSSRAADAPSEPIELVLALGKGLIEVGQGHHGNDRKPAILFGRNGAGAVGIETEGDRVMLPGECIAALTFDNPESLDVVAEKLAELRARIWPESRAADALDSRAPADQAASVPTVADVLAELRADIRELQNNLEAFGEYSQETARVALDGALDALDEVADKYAVPQQEGSEAGNG